MNQFLTEDTKVTIMLCGVWGKGQPHKPLTPTEYNSLVRWLVSKEMRPSDLIVGNSVAEASTGSKIDGDRLRGLLGRGVEVGFAVEEWQRHGIWVLSRSDEEYPQRYKDHLKMQAPPLLFGAGDRSLLKGGGLGIVGSRNVDEEGAEFTRKVAKLCANNQILVVSGGARGVDQISMATALENGGKVIGVLAENLLGASVARTARQAISEGSVLLVSPYHPKARFSVGSAMGRNKLIYAMSDYALVVSTDYNKGGTWAGAVEELKRENAIPVFVRIGEKVPNGNSQLLKNGAIPWPQLAEQDLFEEKLEEQIVSSKNKENSQGKKEIEQTKLSFEDTKEEVSKSKVKREERIMTVAEDPAPQK